MKVRAAAALVALGLVLVPAPVEAAHHRPPPRRCSAGLVALTFDDGPQRRVTPRLVTVLTSRRVPATFFMLGSHVHADPSDARLVARTGFVVGNHTWSHRPLTRLANASIRAELSSTRRELRGRQVRASRLMRPPYGAINRRVSRVVHRVGLTPVLWTIDSRDWASGTSKQIATRVLKRLRPHRTNVVLQHDGVKRSPISVRAVPRIVRGAQARGYCFTSLDGAGHPVVPVPTSTATVTPGNEAGRVPVTVTLTLDRPTSKPVSMRFTTVGASARPGADFVAVDRTVVFPVGSTTARLVVPVVDDPDYERPETVNLRLSRTRGLVVRAPSVPATILSDDAPPSPPAAWDTREMREPV